MEGPVQSLRVALTTVLVLLAGVTLVGPAGAATPTQRAMVEQVNAVRAGHGLSPLGAAPALHRSARHYARWMVRNDYFGHLQRIRGGGRFDLLGETLAWHSGMRPRVAWTVRAWLGSPGHRALLLDPRFRWLGAGMARGRMSGTAATVWVLHLGG
jgi:uncharacterized protein YkwD